MNLDILAPAFNIDNLSGIDADGAIIGLDMQDRIGFLSGKSRFHLQLFAQFPAGRFEFLETERLQQIIHRIDPESLHGELRIRCRKDHGRRMRQRLDEIHSAQVRHIDIQKDSLGLLQIGFRLIGAAAGGHQFQERHLRDIHFQLAQGKRFVVYGNNSDHEAIIMGWAGRIISTS